MLTVRVSYIARANPAPHQNLNKKPTSNQTIHVRVKIHKNFSIRKRLIVIPTHRLIQNTRSNLNTAQTLHRTIPRVGKKQTLPKTLSTCHRKWIPLQNLIRITLSITQQHILSRRTRRNHPRNIRNCMRGFTLQLHNASPH